MPAVTTIPEAPPAAPAPADPPASPRRERHPALRWVRTLAVAVGAALLLRACAVEPFRIPSTSMEETLRAGDYLFVSKLPYGPRLPATVGLPGGRRVPTGLPSVRLPGLSEVARGDVVVFNYPPERGPLDGRTPFIKRVVGLPGDTVRLVGKRVWVNGRAVPAPPGARQLWRVRLARSGLVLDPDALAALGARDRGGHGTERLVEATANEAARLAGLDGVTRVTPFLRPEGDGSARFPLAPAFSMDDYGPVVVPRRGQTVALDDRTWPLVRDAIAREAAAAGHPAPRRLVDGFLVDGARAERYTFREDHFFVLGDNRDDSADSRTWGFVPRSHLIGKAVLVYFSWDPAAGRPRWQRAMRRVE